MVWHGTSIDHVRSILREGFWRSNDGRIWSAEDAAISYYYSFRWASYNPTWQGSPYRNRGALLGCEVAGGGVKVEYGPGPVVRIIENPSCIIARYVLLLPPSEYVAQNQAPVRATVETTMVAAFKKLRSQSGHK